MHTTYEGGGQHQQLNVDENNSTETTNSPNPKQQNHHQLQYFLDAKVFHWKGPILYIFCQMVVVGSIVYAQYDFLDGTLTKTIEFLFMPISCLTYMLYFRAACTNPGYIIGDQQDEKRRAGAFDPRDYQINDKNEANGSQGNPSDANNYFSTTPDQSNNQYSSTGVSSNQQDPNKHQRKKSYLTKGLQISRHERSKTQQNNQSAAIKNQQQLQQQLTTMNDQGNYENLDTISDNQPSFMQNTVHSTNNLQLMNDALNDSKHTVMSRTTNTHNRIPSYVPKNNQSNGSKDDDNNKSLNMSVQEEKRQEAYKMIQQKIASSTNTINYNHENTETIQSVDYSNQGGVPSPFNAINKKFDLEMKNSEETTKAQTNMETNTDNGMPDFGQSKNLLAQAINKENNTEMLTYDTGVEEYNTVETSQQQQLQKQGQLDTIDNSMGTRQSSSADFNTQAAQNKRGNDQMDTIEEEDADGQGNGDNDDVLLFIEYKYCTICHVEQPLRCKHCNECDHCVATFDHYCPWIGNCVGERNRASFYVYLIAQLFQLIFAVPEFLQLAQTDKLGKIPVALSAILVADFLAIVGFFFFVLALLLFHTYLATKNLTSWEYLSWMKITYMKVWPRKYGSPFSRGASTNLLIFFFGVSRSQKYIIPWKMPQKLPKLTA